MNIVHVGEYVSGGVSTYLRTLVELQANNPLIDKITIFISDYKSDQLKFDSPKVSVIRYNYRRTIVGIVRLQFLWKHIRSCSPDIIHLHSSFAGLLRVHNLFPRSGRKFRVVYCAHGWAFARDDSRWKNLLLSYFERILAHGCDKIINISKSEENIANTYKLPSSKMVLVRNGIRIHFLNKRSKYDCETILFVGRFDRQKGVDLLLKAAEKLPAINFRLAGTSVVGGFDLSGYKLPNNVKLLGWLSSEQVAVEMSRADALIIPSRWEGFGLVALEGMINQAAILASNVGGLKELVENGVNGFLFKPASVRAIVSLLDGIDRETLAKLGRQGYDRVVESYNAEDMVDAINKIYITMLNDK